MAESSSQRRRDTITGRRVRQYLGQRVKIFLENKVALDGKLLDYFWDPIEKDGCFVLSSDQGDTSEPSLVFRRFTTSFQPAPGVSTKKKV